ncbi:MAG: hypothetical protein E2O89_05620 [Alphaproteobacteria bacterium]|nr:MAG: hypothetical protein E2O89_05620 [Alphaproteobacteria bacterium]
MNTCLRAAVGSHLRFGIPSYLSYHRLSVSRALAILGKHVSGEQILFINFWYAAEESENVTSKKPVHVRMLGQDFVLFGDSLGKAHCLSNVCAHRRG